MKNQFPSSNIHFLASGISWYSLMVSYIYITWNERFLNHLSLQNQSFKNTLFFINSILHQHLTYLCIQTGIIEMGETAKVVTFGGRMHQILREFDKGNRDGYNTIIEQLADVELDHRKLNKIINEVTQ